MDQPQQGASASARPSLFSSKPGGPSADHRILSALEPGDPFSTGSSGKRRASMVLLAALLVAGAVIAGIAMQDTSRLTSLVRPIADEHQVPEAPVLSSGQAVAENSAAPEALPPSALIVDQPDLALAGNHGMKIAEASTMSGSVTSNAGAADTNAPATVEPANTAKEAIPQGASDVMRTALEAPDAGNEQTLALTPTVANSPTPPRNAAGRAKVAPAQGPATRKEPVRQQAAAKKAAPTKPARAASDIQLAAQKKTGANKTKPLNAAESDIALLSAIVAHSSERQSEHSIRPAKSSGASGTQDRPAKTRAVKTAAAESSGSSANRDIVERLPGETTHNLLQRCREFGLLEGELCRWRICSGQWESDAACRVGDKN